MTLICVVLKQAHNNSCGPLPKRSDALTLDPSFTENTIITWGLNVISHEQVICDNSRKATICKSVEQQAGTEGQRSAFVMLVVCFPLQPTCKILWPAQSQSPRTVLSAMTPGTQFQYINYLTQIHSLVVSEQTWSWYGGRKHYGCLP